MKLLAGIGHVHAIDFGRILEAAKMLAYPEKGRSESGLVAADPLEYRAAVTDDVRKDMDLGVLPADEVAVMPDFFGGCQHGLIITWRVAYLWNILTHAEYLNDKWK